MGDQLFKASSQRTEGFVPFTDWNKKKDVTDKHVYSRLAITYAYLSCLSP